ncbi:MAG: TadE/TadG family type IV pilus assembly protein [Sulfitobacter sp.]
MIRLARHLPRFARDENGATLVEFAIVVSIFLFLFFSVIDFARLGYTNVTAEKATNMAARMAVVRGPACDGVATVTDRGLLIGTLSLDLPNGTPCTERAGLCKQINTVTCTGTTSNATALAIWTQVRPLLPNNAAIENLQFSYSFDENLNRVGAPYSPMVTVELADLQFDFISPLGALARAAGAADSNLGESFTFNSMSASLPAETIR